MPYRLINIIAVPWAALATLIAGGVVIPLTISLAWGVLSF